MKINKDTKIEKIIQNYPKTIEVFKKYDFHCINCPAARLETIEQGAMVHNIDIDKLIKELNKKIM